MDGCVSDQLQWLSVNHFCQLKMSHWLENMSSAITMLLWITDFPSPTFRIQYCLSREKLCNCSTWQVIFQDPCPKLCIDWAERRSIILLHLMSDFLRPNFETLLPELREVVQLLVLHLISDFSRPLSRTPHCLSRQNLMHTSWQIFKYQHSEFHRREIVKLLHLLIDYSRPTLITPHCLSREKL